MDPLERDLAELLTRREAPDGFRASVMERVRAEAERQPASVVEMPRSAWKRPWSKTWRWAAAGSLAASLTIGFFVQNHNRKQRVADERAEAELMDALQVAGLKIHQAREKIYGASAEGEPQ